VKFLKSKTTNPDLFQTIRILKKKANETGVAIWNNIADSLSRSKDRRLSVNISRINRFTKSKDKVIVPGKILASGILNHPVHVAAFSFSQGAKAKILKAQGKCYSIKEFVDKHPNGRGVKIIG
jgi:large subunit ribosomal protein L18e